MVNVSKLNQQESVFKYIQSFLRNKGVKSQNTEKAYENDIRQFFLYMRNKEIERLVEIDLQFKNADMMDYQTYLYCEFVQTNGKKYSNITINRKMNTIVALYASLKRNGYSVDPDIMKIEDLPDDSKQIGFLNVDEIDHMLLLTDDIELKYFIMLALRTSLRKDALISLEWEQIQQSHNNPDCYIITTIDKGKRVEKEIHKTMYDLLLNLKKENNPNVFHIPIRTLDYRFKSLCKKVGIDEKRKISIHSLKKAGVSYVKELTGDIHAAQMQAGHSSPVTTSKYYLERKTNLAGMMLDIKLDDNIFEQLTHQELLNLIRGFGNGIGHQLKLRAKKIIDGRSLGDKE